MSLYVLDTSAWLGGWVRHYPPDTFGSLWRNIERKILSNTIVSPDEVLKELEKKEDELVRWARQYPSLFRPIDEPIQRAVTDVLEMYPKLVDQRKNRSQGDPFVVALAKIAPNATVVTEEKQGHKSPHIPDVCEGLDIPCIGLLRFIREQGWRF